MLNEVITKRVPAFVDLRKGLASVKVSQTTLLNLLERLPDFQKRAFPPHTGKIDDMVLKLHLEWRETADPINQTFLQYIDELHKKGDPNIMMYTSCNQRLISALEVQ